jgi:glyoxalase family protein
MLNNVCGIHHVTAIATSAKQNLQFYAHVLGQRLVKKTVNFDEPETYHLYYGNQLGSPGSIIAFFLWEDIQAGQIGPRQATEVAYSVSERSFDFWIKRFKKFNVPHQKVNERFGESYLSFQDLDGLNLSLIASNVPDLRPPWETGDINAIDATKGFHSITIIANDINLTADFLIGVFGYCPIEQKNNRYRFATGSTNIAAIIDLIEASGKAPGQTAGGSIHHVAFRVPNEDVLMAYRNKIIEAGIYVTDKIDRNYFYAIYFREPGGVLFELATDIPGFTVDEAAADLGIELKLPHQYEPRRVEIEAALPKLY